MFGLHLVLLDRCVTRVANRQALSHIYNVWWFDSFRELIYGGF